MSYIPRALDDARYANTSGDTMTGPLALPADPTQPLEAATKQYADTRGAGAAFNGVTNSVLGGYQLNYLLLTARTMRWGDTTVTDSTNLPSGYFRVSKAGAWRFIVQATLGWSGDGLYMSGTGIVNCAATNYVYGCLMLDGVTGSVRKLLGVHVSGTSIYFNEEITPANPSTITNVQCTVSAEYLGPGT